MERSVLSSRTPKQDAKPWGPKECSLHEIRWHSFGSNGPQQTESIHFEKSHSKEVGLSQFGEMNREVEEALDEHGQAMVRILEEADQLRLSTVKELVM
ncbi:hypothetical protein ACE6H2_001256 [Prunus campanulata]